LRLNGKVAIVTGSGQGIGRETALCLAREGASVAIADITDKAFVVADKIKSLNGKAVAYKCNVTNWQEVNNMVIDVVKKFGKIDILVNNAGIRGPRSFITEIKEEEWDEVIAVNLKGPFLITKAVLPFMIKQKKGKIINIASIAGLISGLFNALPYSASKAGLIGFTRSLALEVGQYGINVNAICPGFIATEMTLGVVDKSKHTVDFEVFRNEVPLKREGKPEDIANLVAFLASDDANYITGQIIVCDGGWTLRLIGQHSS
jgi:3-oxoacyl-[acyl-carrier protein] reductase